MKKKETIRQNLNSLLNQPISEVDNPLLACILLGNISENDLPIKLAKRGLTQIETINDDSATITKEASIRADLLTRYNTIVSLVERLQKANQLSQLTPIQEAIKRL